MNLCEIRPLLKTARRVGFDGYFRSEREGWKYRCSHPNVYECQIFTKFSLLLFVGESFLCFHCEKVSRKMNKEHCRSSTRATFERSKGKQENKKQNQNANVSVVANGGLYQVGLLRHVEESVCTNSWLMTFKSLRLQSNLLLAHCLHSIQATS